MDLVVKNNQVDFVKDKKLETFIKKEGKQIYDKNTFLKDLHNMMQNEQFREFYDKYYKDWGEIKVMMMYMKLYENIETEYLKKYNEKISKEMIMYIIREIIRNNDTRQFTLKKFKEFEEGINNKNKQIKNKQIKDRRNT